jgi:hypothetical protein
MAIPSHTVIINRSAFDVVKTIAPNHVPNPKTSLLNVHYAVMLIRQTTEDARYIKICSVSEKNINQTPSQEK